MHYNRNGNTCEILFFFFAWVVLLKVFLFHQPFRLDKELTVVYSFICQTIFSAYTLYSSL